MNKEDIKNKLVESNGGGDAYNRGIQKANRTAKIWINKVFNHFEENEKKLVGTIIDIEEKLIKSEKDCDELAKDFHDLQIAHDKLFDIAKHLKDNK